MMHRRHFLGAVAASTLLAPAAASANPGLRWEQRRGKATQIAIGANGQVWALGINPVAGGLQIFRRDNDRWTLVPGGLMTLAVDAQGLPWGTNDQQVIYRMQAGKWERLPGRAEQVAIGGKGTVFALGKRGPNDVETVVHEWGGGVWTPIAGQRGTRIAVDENDYPWLLKAGGEIVRHNGGAWENLPGRGQDIGIGARGGVWAIGHDAKGAGGFGIHRFNGRGWDRVDGAATSVAVNPRGLPWVVNAEGNIFERV